MSVKRKYNEEVAKSPVSYDQEVAYPPPQPFSGQQFFSDPVASMAMEKYGSNLDSQGKEHVHKNIEKFVSPSKLKYYFAVDSLHLKKDWPSVLSFHTFNEPVAPHYEINAPDLYIPVMAFVTYILVAGIVLGTQDRFTPEQLGIQASTALVWVIIELLASLVSFYLLSINTDLRYTDILTYLGYKFVGMIFSLLAGLAFHSKGYYITLLWFVITLVFFLLHNCPLLIHGK